MLVLTLCAFAAPPALSLLPFGVGVYAHHKPVRGILYSVVQAAGFTTLAIGSARADAAEAADDQAAYYRWEGISALGATAGFGGWLVSAVDGGRLHELEAASTADRLRTWDLQLLAARGNFDD
jgi:hypothetical protein